MTRRPSEGGPPTSVPGARPQPSNQPIDESAVTVPLETEEGEEMVIGQNAGGDSIRGGGEWPDPEAPSEPPAPGSA